MASFSTIVEVGVYPEATTTRSEGEGGEMTVSSYKIRKKYLKMMGTISIETDNIMKEVSQNDRHHNNRD